MDSIEKIVAEMRALVSGEAGPSDAQTRMIDVRKLADRLEALSKPTRYPWNQAPDWAMWAATDSDGISFWYGKKPYAGEIGWRLTSTHWKSIGRRIESDDWRNSLEKRPEKS